MGATLVAEEHGVALSVIPCILGFGHDFHQAAISVLAEAGADAFADDRALGVLADVDHLGTGIGLLAVFGKSDGVEFADGVVTLQDEARIYPGEGGTCFHLRPGDLGVFHALAALGDEVVDAAASGFRIAGIPVLDGGVFDGGAGEGDQFDDGGVKLVFIPLRGRATFEVAHLCAFIRDDERPFKLASAFGIDTEIGAKFHRAFDALGDIGEGAIGEDGGV